MEKIFKAKRIDNGEWVEFDSIIHCNEKCYFFKYGSGDFDSIPLSKETEIDKNTICQYTGIDAKNGRIFEGDEMKPNKGETYYVKQVCSKASGSMYVRSRNTSSFYDYILNGTLTGHNIHDKV